MSQRWRLCAARRSQECKTRNAFGLAHASTEAERSATLKPRETVLPIGWFELDVELGRTAMLSIKAELRSSALKRRNSIDEEDRAAFTARLAVVGPPLVLECLPSVGKPITAVFSPIGSEPDTSGLAAALHAAGVRLVLPVDLSHGSALTFREWIPGDRLAVGPLGIAEPLADAPERDPDVLVLPLVAFDRRGHRVGYGAGNYDRTLAALRKRKQVRVIGVAYAVQEERFIPNEPHDEPVDLVLTDRNVILCQT